jgi:plasmid stabilization system protein ParE
MRRFAIIVSARASREIDEAARWWAERGSTTRIDNALAATLQRLQTFPEIAPRAKLKGKWSAVRRAPVDPVGYHLYYRVDRQTEVIFVECFWHASRRPPRL